MKQEVDPEVDGEDDGEDDGAGNEKIVVNHLIF